MVKTKTVIIDDDIHKKIVDKQQELIKNTRINIRIGDVIGMLVNNYIDQIKSSDIFKDIQYENNTKDETTKVMT